MSRVDLNLIDPLIGINDGRIIGVIDHYNRAWSNLMSDICVANSSSVLILSGLVWECGISLMGSDGSRFDIVRLDGKLKKHMEAILPKHTKACCKFLMPKSLEAWLGE